MVMNINYQSNRRTTYITRKRLFLTLLLVNSFLGSIYYLHEQDFRQTLYPANQINDDGITLTRALQSIRSTLENEYNHDDLVKFYQLVQYEYALGLRCTRPNTTQTTVSSVKPNQSTSAFKASRTKVTVRRQREDFHKFVIDHSQVCAEEPVDLLIIIISKSENYKTRDAIRRTWASGKQLGSYSSINVKFFFLVDMDDKLLRQVHLENELFHDIIQVELPQQYTLVTHRVLSLFEWSFRFCRSAKFLFKTDDDIFINILLLLKFVRPLLSQSIDRSFLPSKMEIYGYQHAQPIVFRTPSDAVIARYVVTKDEFPCDFYPNFLSGFGYLIPRKARDAIVYTAYQDPEPFRISDVYLTGIIPDYLSVKRQSMSGYEIYQSGDCEPFFNASKVFACATDSHYGNQADVFDRFYRYWQAAQKFF